MKDEFNEHHREIEARAPLYDQQTRTKRLDPNDEGFRWEMENELSAQEISKRLGNYKKALGEFSRARVELKYIKGISAKMPGFLAYLIHEFYTDGNPYHIDLALLACKQANIEPPPSIITATLEASEKRLNKEATGTAKGATTPLFINEALHLMLMLRFVGATIDEAQSKAAQFLYNKHGRLVIKGSTLERKYNKQYRKDMPQSVDNPTPDTPEWKLVTELGLEPTEQKEPLAQTLEDWYFERFEVYMTPGVKNYWKSLRDNLSNANENIKGERRLKDIVKGIYGCQKLPSITKFALHNRYRLKQLTGDIKMTHYLSDKAVAARYESSRATVWRWVKEGKLPRPVKLASGTTRWKLSDLQSWESAQEVSR